MLPKFVGAVAAGLALAALGPSVSSAGNQRIPTTVLMEEVTSDGDGEDLIEGAVVSPNRKCVLGRRVDIFEQAVEGPPIKLGTAFADSNEHLTLRGQIEINQTGRIFGKAAKVKLRNGKVCKADRSAILEINI
jgi:hypothetical protein